MPSYENNGNIETQTNTHRHTHHRWWEIVRCTLMVIRARCASRCCYHEGNTERIQTPCAISAASLRQPTLIFVLLRLPQEVEGVFAQRLQEAFPLRAAKVMSLLRQTRGGRTQDGRFHARMRGEGPRWQLMVDLFERSARAHGLQPPPPPGPSSFRRPGAQQLLFGDQE